MVCIMDDLTKIKKLKAAEQPDPGLHDPCAALVLKVMLVTGVIATVVFLVIPLLTR